MTGTALRDAVLRLERAIVRLERRPATASTPVAPAVPHADEVERLRQRHARLRTRVEEAVRSLDRLIGDDG